MRLGSALAFGLLPILACGTGCHKKGAKQASLVLYTGYGSSAPGMLYGRVQKGPPDPTPEPGQSKIQRIQETLQALDASALPHAAVDIKVGDHLLSATSDDRGYLEVTLPAKLAPPAVPVEIHLRTPGYDAPPLAGSIPVYDGTAGLAVVSDVDDTVLDSQITDKSKMVKNALLRSTWELVTFPDAPQVLSQFGKDKPVFYLSGSPWGFHSRIASFFARVGLPMGTIILKRFSSEPLLDQMGFKYPHLLDIAKALPEKKLILFGDSGEKDPEIYARLRSEQPSRVEQIYIHLVTKEAPDSPRFTGMKVFQNWSELRP